MTCTPKVAVIGAGLGGLCAGIKLKEAGVDELVILEKARRSAARGATTRILAAPAILPLRSINSRSRRA